MFGLTKKDCSDERELADLRTRMSMVELREGDICKKEIALERRSRLLQVSEEVVRAKEQIADEWKKMEHEYHSGMEKMRTKLACLGAQVAERKAHYHSLCNHDSVKSLLEEKDKQIAFLTGLVEKLLTKSVRIKNFAGYEEEIGEGGN